ncbi:PQQ-binding-like beta-propeller repeat protein [Telmatocola sphagniphila]|uniref:PQQ-binding-like beta-propeller repeat protein n=1 Tax=Telmatocola sphagniphila TaxID=1123043 RepID=A0A8E6EWI5_9BACT|nr:PQQ-binding-like beta-propeller repeat protein [Telmatocola sphagniphila]QVL30176.1 PQQ-binding-like beta-propeller repeat protein [Telmatocola sphagniphila]
MLKFGFVLAGSLVLSAGLSAQDWPQFRGPNFSGVSLEKKALPASWSEKENILWKTPLEQRGVSSPVVFDDRIYLTANSGFRLDKLHVLCLDKKTGKILWQRELTATGNTGCHPKSNMSAPTPVADASGVYALFATGDLAAFEKDGKLRWYRSLVSDYPTIGNQVGMSSSPILANNTLVIPMVNSGESFIAGIDPRYGNNIWKTEREKDTNWSTPLTVAYKSGTQVVMMGKNEVVSYSPESGKALWKFPTGSAAAASPTIAGDKILVPAGGVVAIAMDGADKAKEVWKQQKLFAGYSSPVFYEDRVYNISGAGVIVCADAKTGKDLWQERTKTKGKYWASPIVGDGKLYVCADDGIVTVAKTGDKPEILAVNDMKDEIMGTPAISDGCIFLRTTKAMYCIGTK